MDDRRAEREQREHFEWIRSLPPPPDEIDDEGHLLPSKRRFNPVFAPKPRARKATAR